MRMRRALMDGIGAQGEDHASARPYAAAPYVVMNETDFLFERWTRLVVELDAARERFNAAHVSLLARTDVMRVCSGDAYERVRDLDAHDAAAEEWFRARSALAAFCREHPNIC